MIDAKAYFDYNIDKSCFENDNCESTIKMLYDFGYRTVAINHTVDLASSQPKKKKKDNAKEQELVPEPFQPNIVEKYQDMKILSRLTITYNSGETYTRLSNSPNYRKYDIIAVMPLNPAAILFTSSNIHADIFCLTHENRIKIKHSRKLFNALIEKGFHFELCYGPVIEDRTARKAIIQIAHVFHSMAKSKNVIVSSGATKPFLIRSPYDIINLGLLFGLSEQQAKNSISHCGRRVYVNSVGRRYGKTVTIVEKIEEPVEQIEDESVIIIDEEGPEERKSNDGSVIFVESDIEMLDDTPAAKRVKQ